MHEEFRSDVTCIATTIPAAAESSECPPPAWVGELFADAASKEMRNRGRARISLTTAHASHYTLITAQLADAAEMADGEFRERTAECYAAIAASLHGMAPARFWNHLPNIHSAAQDNLDRYMVFNAGRYDAFLAWYGATAHFDTRLATASAIGHSGLDLIVHCLATDQRISAIDNPRQIQPHRYSARFGPQPPCFARATRVGDLLLVGGTASVRGEESMHVGDLARQTEETFANLDALLHAADPRTARAAFRELRVYFPQAGDAEAIVQSVGRAFPELQRVELMQADLCRKELLVEIEGLADL